MTFIVWFAMLGTVLLLLALSSSYLRWMPVTTSLVCLGLGMALSSPGLGFLHLEVAEASGWLEHLTEVAVLFSLFFQRTETSVTFAQPGMADCVTSGRSGHGVVYRRRLSDPALLA